MNSPARFAMLLMGMLLAYQVHAEPEEWPAIPDTFTKALVDGINSRKLERLRPVIHPDSLACITAKTRPYYEWVLWKDGSNHYTIPAKYSVRRDKPINVARAEAAMTAASFIPQHWPVQPDVGLYLLYNSAPMSMTERLFEVSVKDGKAWLVLECPTEMGMQRFHEKMEETASLKTKLKTIWAGMSQEDQKKFSALAKEGHKLEGIKLAEKNYHLDTNEALLLMDLAQDARTP